MNQPSLPLAATLAALAWMLVSTPAGAAPLAEGPPPVALRPDVAFEGAIEGAIEGAESPVGLASGRDWLLKTADNICGLRDPNQLTYPALIDFDGCLEATPELKRIRDQGIDPKSAEGIQLRSAAVTRLTSACESVRSANGHCSVWKEIRHKDGRAIADVSSQVIALF